MTKQSIFRLSIWSGPTQVNEYAEILQKNVPMDQRIDTEITKGTEFVHITTYAENLTELENWIRDSLCHGFSYRHQGEVFCKRID